MHVFGYITWKRLHVYTEIRIIHINLRPLYDYDIITKIYIFLESIKLKTNISHNFNGLQKC